MAEPGYSFITKIHLFSSTSLSAGSSGTSRAIDLREITTEGIFSIGASIANGTAGTCGTTVFTYAACETSDGTFATPSLAEAIGTCGTSNMNDTISFYPFLTPFMKIIATQTGSGNVGNDSVVTATLNVQ
jgi:hypothetical protein